MRAICGIMAQYEICPRRSQIRVNIMMMRTTHQRMGMSRIKSDPSVVQTGHVEEILVAEELWNDHKKLIFFPFSSAATCTNRPLEVDQRTTLCQNRESLVRNPKHCPFSVRFRRRPCERNGPIGRVLRSCCDRKPVAF
ncbi:hypothetical protein Taro_052802 [Colocasia esculenta]|uniref:Uncharacterized protein n=1 Tax=Colocasia esculenta TaxID=4460 RepID=A0A843XJL4_COLES|nr:hypothetical protein [Colocasia esculenta]